MSQDKISWEISLEIDPKKKIIEKHFYQKKPKECGLISTFNKMLLDLTMAQCILRFWGLDHSD